MIVYLPAICVDVRMIVSGVGFMQTEGYLTQSRIFFEHICATNTSKTLRKTVYVILGPG
jgi:hypothetical protein